MLTLSQIPTSDPIPTLSQTPSEIFASHGLFLSPLSKRPKSAPYNFQHTKDPKQEHLRDNFDSNTIQTSLLLKVFFVEVSWSTFKN